MGFLRDGEVFITGRLKDMLIFNGVNHYPQDIELTFGVSHPDLVPSACAAVTVERDGQDKLVVVAEIVRGRIRNMESFEPVY